MGATCDNESETEGKTIKTSTRKNIINELLASLRHAIICGKTDAEITQAFVAFYDDSAVKKARDALNPFCNLPKRSARTKKDPAATEAARVIDVNEMVGACRVLDYAGLNLNFVICNISEICYVNSGLGDELHLRNELRQMQHRLSTVESICKSLSLLTEKIDGMQGTLNALETAVKTPSYRDKLKVSLSNDDQSVNNGASSSITAKSSRPNIQPRPTTINPWAKDPFDARRNQPILQPYQSTPNLESNEWKTVTKKKRPMRHVVGSSENYSIKATAVKPFKVFATKVHRDTNVDDFKSHFMNLNWEMLAIEQLKTRYDTYNFYKITLNKFGNGNKEFLKPEHWPKGVLVRPFLTKRWSTFDGKMNAGGRSSLI